mmetsp:Transcript_65338/g.156195  ORF Transcript_65338/g.156195 Transcript_65338/m.156195 type:complete len:896 (-) Transcript_65338:38-2725(-)
MSGLLLLPRLAFKLLLIFLQILFSVWFLWSAYDIRCNSVKEFGYIIHEFDPWFNYRAAEYLADNGLEKFFKWYDYESWYPLGRPIGTTIYPGMQMTAVAIRDFHQWLGPQTLQVPGPLQLLNPIISYMRGAKYRFLPPTIPTKIEFTPMSVNDICCMIPAWFGLLAALFTGLLTYEMSRSTNAMVAAFAIMAVIPAHLMRSMAGEFDNEAIAMTAICMTFWLWCRSIRSPGWWPIGVLTGFSYIYMVAAWGGYIFVLNMIGAHCAMLVGLGRFNSGVHKAYSLFYIIGTYGATRIPVVGMTPLRSLEQMMPLLVFLGIQVLEFCDRVRSSKSDWTSEKFFKFRIRVFIICGLAAAGCAVLLYPTGYFGPLSARIRGLFVKHTKTGNPLVDSVAEHQPASSGVYASYLNLPLDYALLGVVVGCFNRNNSFYFGMLYAFIAEHFSGKMSRLVLICAPICTIGAAMWAGFVLDFVIGPFLLLLGQPGYKADKQLEPEKEKTNGKDSGSKNSGKDSGSSKDKNKGKAEAKAPKKKGKQSNRKFEIELGEWEYEVRPGGMAEFKRTMKETLWTSFVPEEYEDQYDKARMQFDRDSSWLWGRAIISLLIVFYYTSLSSLPGKSTTFLNHCQTVARQLSSPMLVTYGRDKDGKFGKIDDYLKGYQWIDANTPKDARVMAWWDYGYQITGVAKRTSIADGNTWNHEHIATLGRMLTSPEKKAWNAIRHLADYVMVWAGGGGDDLGKSPHLARIGNSVFPDHCGDDDPKCNKFGFYSDQSPTPMMAKSLLYRLVKHGSDNVRVNESLFKHVHTTRNGKLRVFQVVNISQESKDWIADPSNRICDAPGSWYCVGQYPPAIRPLIEKRRNFAQVEDFNAKGEVSAYTKLIEQERAGGGARKSHSEF